MCPSLLQTEASKDRASLGVGGMVVIMIIWSEKPEKGMEMMWKPR